MKSIFRIEPTKALAIVALLAAGCGDSDPSGQAAMDAGPQQTGTTDAGAPDSGSAPVDGGVSVDTGVEDPCAAVTCGQGACDPSTLECICEVGWAGETCETPTLPSEESLVLWLDAADLQSLSFEGNTVTEWLDKGPAGQSFTPAGLGNGPSLSNAGSRPALRFDGVDDHLQTTGFEGLTNKLRYTMFVVVSANAGNNVMNGWQGDNERFRLVDSNQGMSFVHTVPADDDVAVTGVGLGNYERGEVQVITVQRTNMDTSIWVDGGDRMVFDASTPEPLPGALSVVIGDDLAQHLGNPLNGLLAEVLVFDAALDFSKREDVERYLAAKWTTKAPKHDMSSVGNTVLWLDADDEASFTIQDGAVRYWASRVFGLRIEAAAVATRPTRVDDGLNGRSVVRFDGVDDVLVSPQLNLTAAEGYTVAAVFRRADGTNGPVLFGVDDENRPAVMLQAETGPERFRFTHRSPPGFSGGSFIGAADGPLSDPLRALVAVNELTLAIDARFADGTQEDEVKALMQPGQTDNLTWCVGGSRPLDTVDNFDGDVAELLVFRRTLNARERAYVADKLDAKWGM